MLVVFVLIRSSFGFGGPVSVLNPISDEVASTSGVRFCY